MKWSEVRERFPDQFVLVEEIASHIEGDNVLVDDVAVIRAIPEEEATKRVFAVWSGYSNLIESDKGIVFSSNR